jgi:hypothetical protein
MPDLNRSAISIMLNGQLFSPVSYECARGNRTTVRAKLCTYAARDYRNRIIGAV